nr:unnamed protein product [Callosobruchus chinensis]
MSHSGDYGETTFALELRNSFAHLTELLHGQLHKRTKQAKVNLTTFAYDIQRSAKRVFVSSPIEIQEYVSARQFVEGIAKPNVQQIVGLTSPRTLQDALVKALDIEAAKRVTRITRRVSFVEQYDKVEVKSTSFI